MRHTNVEVKADYDDHDRVRRLLRERDAREVGTDHQTDTYFDVPEGRLKLREGDVENYLVHYDRGDRAEPRPSDVHLHETGADATDLKATLRAALGVDVVVEKTREIYFLDRVKFHLDDIDGLGRYVEIEVIDREGTADPDDLRADCRRYMDLFGIDDGDLVAESYSDLLR